MDLEDPQPLLKQFFIRFILQPLCELKDRWLNFISVQYPVEDASKMPIDMEALPEMPSDVPVEEKKIPCNAERQNRFSIAFGAVGTIVGLSQLWRFPVLAYKTGGGTFVLLYVAMTLLFGYPVLFFELANGQYSGQNAVSVFGKVPIMQGIGVSMIINSFVLGICYNQLVGFGFHYFSSSFDLTVPWSKCKITREGNPEQLMCYPISWTTQPGIHSLYCETKNVLYNATALCREETYAKEIERECCSTMLKIHNVCNYYNRSVLCDVREPSAAYYWHNTVAKGYPEDDPGYGYLGPVNLKMILCSFAAWVSVYVLTYLNVKLRDFLALITLPIGAGILIGIIFQTIDLDGSYSALSELFTPKIEDLKNSKVWYAAAEQTLYSLCVATGVAIHLGSKSSFRSPCHVTSLTICLVVIVMSVLSAAAVVSVLGSMEHRMFAPFSEFLKSDVGLVFIAYSEGLTNFSIPWVFSTAFFFAFAVMGITTVSRFIDSISQSLAELTPDSKWRKHIFTFLLVCSSFLMGIPILTRGGLVIFEILDLIPGGMSLPILCVLELFTVIFLYGLGTFCEDIAFMIGWYPNRINRYVWVFTPFLFLGLVSYSSVSLTLPPWKHWTIILGWSCLALVLCPIVIVFIFKLISSKRSDKYKKLFQPPETYGPKNETLRSERSTFETNKSML